MLALIIMLFLPMLVWKVLAMCARRALPLCAALLMMSLGYRVGVSGFGLVLLGASCCMISAGVLDRLAKTRLAWWVATSECMASCASAGLAAYALLVSAGVGEMPAYVMMTLAALLAGLASLQFRTEI